MTYAKVWQLLECSPLDCARMIPHLSVCVLEEGEEIFTPGDEARYLYVIHEGRVRLTAFPEAPDISDGFLGEECGLGLATYQGGAIAASRTTVTRIPREVFARLVQEYPDLKARLYASFHERITGSQAPQLHREMKTTGEARASLWQPLGWLLTIGLAALVFFARSYLRLDLNSILFFTVFTATIVMWVFNLVDEFIPALFAIAMLLILDVAPASVVLAGFGSEEFFMILSVSALGAVIETSGLAYRAILQLLKRTPASQFWCNLMVVLPGIGLSALLPSSNGRVSLAMPIYRDMMDILGYVPNGKAATALASAMFCGMTLFSGLFLTSKTVHFVVYGMLPEQIVQQYGFVYWTVAAVIYGIVMFLLYFVTASLLFRNTEPVRISKTQSATQVQVLGPMSYREVAAAIGILFMIFGFVTTSLHKIDPPWIALALLFILLALNVLNKKQFQQKINWSFLIYLGSLTGLSKVMSYTGLDQWFGNHLGFVIHAMQANFPLFVLLLFLAITAVRFFVPNNATVVIFASLLLPMASIAGIHPWIVGFIILCFSDTWIFPYQCTYYLEFQELNEHQALYEERAFLHSTLFTNVFRLAAVFVSIPYWKWLGIL